MARRRQQAITEAMPFQREGWSGRRRRQGEAPGMRILYLMQDAYERWWAAGAKAEDAAAFCGGALTPIEREVLERLAAGEKVIGLDLPQDEAMVHLRHLAEGWRDWIGDYGDEDEEGA